MAINLTLSLPRTIMLNCLPAFDIYEKNATWVRANTKALLSEWLSTNSGKVRDLTDVDVLNDVNRVRIPLSLGGDSEEILKQFMSASGETASKTVSLIMHAISHTTIDHENSATISVGCESFVDILNSSGFTQSRKEQQAFYLQVMDALKMGKIGFSEAATGTGKTAAMLISAAQIAIEKQSRVAITVPTIGLIKQFKSNYDRLSDAIFKVLGEVPALRTIYGQHEYVSQGRMMALMEDEGCDPLLLDFIKAWLKRSVGAESAYWMRSNLESCALEANIPFPFNEVSLHHFSDSSDAGMIAYKTQFEHEEVHECEVCIFTHAMLGIDFRLRSVHTRNDHEVVQNRKYISYLKYTPYLNKVQRVNNLNLKSELESDIGNRLRELSDDQHLGLLPNYRYLIVDEVHQLEENLSGVLSDYISLRELSRDLNQLASITSRIVSKKTIKEVQAAIACLVDLNISGGYENELTINYRKHDGGSALMTSLNKISTTIENIKSPSNKIGDEANALYRKIKRDGYLLNNLMKGTYGLIKFSPVRQYPQIYVGKPSLESFLKRLWASIDGASLVSATIFIPKGDSYSAWYLKTILCTPDIRTKEYQVNIPNFLYEPIINVYKPSDDEENARLTPPSYTHDNHDEVTLRQATESFHNNICTKLCDDIIPTASGGILVLATSYETCSFIGQALSSALEYCTVIYAKQHYPVSRQRHDFLLASGKNKQCVWVTCGAAWLGLDVSGQSIQLDPLDDNVLTDLVIPRLPFNLNRSIVHNHRRIHRKSINWDFFEAAFSLRQGLGRLVRSQGLPKNRRIWLMDGRLFMDQSKVKYKVFLKIMEPYFKIGSK